MTQEGTTEKAEHRPQKLLYKFKIKETEEDAIYEVKYLDVPKESDAALKFQWFIEQEGVKQKLQFQSMDGERREFMNGMLLDMAGLTLKTKEGTVYQLQECAV